MTLFLQFCLERIRSLLILFQSIMLISYQARVGEAGLSLTRVPADLGRQHLHELERQAPTTLHLVLRSILTDRDESAKPLRLPQIIESLDCWLSKLEGARDSYSNHTFVKDCRYHTPL